MSLPIRPDEVIPADLAGPEGEACTALTELIDHMRDAAGRLDELTDPAAREVGRWLRRRAQQAAIEARRT